MRHGSWKRWKHYSEITMSTDAGQLLLVAKRLNRIEADRAAH
jgi:hypothetical protein